VPGPRLIGAPEGRYDVTIVGAGFAGAAAARELSGGGRRVLVLEARDRVGGRTWFDPERLGGRPAELGGAFVLDRGTYPLVWAEIDRHGLELDWGPAGPADLIWHTGGERRVGPLPVPFSELASLERSFAHVREAASRIDPALPLEEQRVEDLDVTPAEFFGRAELGPHTRDLWRARIADVAGDDWDVPSVLPLLAGVAASGGSVVAAAFIDGPVDTPMARAMGPQLRNGTRALHAAVLGESDADIVLRAPVTGIQATEEAVTVEHPGGAVTCGAAIVAVPLGVVADIGFDPPLAPAHVEIAREGVAGGTEKLTALVANCPRPFLAYGFPPGGGLIAAATTSHDGDRASVVAFTSHRGTLDPNDAGAVQAALRAYCPEITVEAVTGHDWAGDPFARGTWSYYRPGQSLRVPRLARRRGRVAFAGSDYERRLGIEGALASGMAAAAGIRDLEPHGDGGTVKLP
jgi:(S)-6-hydroxynicotine oxidase